MDLWLAGWEKWTKSPGAGERDAQGPEGAAPEGEGEGEGDDAAEEGDAAEAGAAANGGGNDVPSLYWQVRHRAMLDINAVQEYIGDHAKLDGGTATSYPPTVRSLLLFAALPRTLGFVALLLRSVLDRCPLPYIYNLAALWLLLPVH